jgi:hypothetical protein
MMCAVTTRADALAHVQHLATDPRLRARLGFGKDGMDIGMISASKCLAPEESWTGRWSWWHRVPTVKVDGEGTIVLACARREGKGFDVLAIPAAWIREHSADLKVRSGAYDLFISAERDDRFRERRGRGTVDLSPFLVEPVAGG